MVGTEREPHPVYVNILTQLLVHHSYALSYDLAIREIEDTTILILLVVLSNQGIDDDSVISSPVGP
jgi:hypothetical protein